MSLRWKVAQRFELQWWKGYFSNKKKEEYLKWKRRYWENVLSKVSSEIKIVPAKTIIDLGCGPAGIFIAFSENKVTAVDPLLDEYEKQIPFFKRSDYPNTVFVTKTLEEFETTAKYDMVFCTNAINHVRDIEKGFDKLKQLCSDNGAIIISIDAHNFSFFQLLFRIIPADVLHPHQYSLSDYTSFLEKRRMRVLKTELLKKEFFFSHYLLLARK